VDGKLAAAIAGRDAARNAVVGPERVRRRHLALLLARDVPDGPAVDLAQAA